MNPEIPWIIFGSLSMLGLGGWLLRPLVLGLGRRLEGRGMDAGAITELDDLRAQMRDLEGVQRRVAELEERVDFTERLLSQPQQVQDPRPLR